MKKFKITKYFRYSETLIVEAENEAEAVDNGLASCANEERIYGDTLLDIEAVEVSAETPITESEQ